MNNPFPKRIEAVRSNLDAWQAEALLVTRMVNCRWLSGFTGSSASLLISTDKALLATDSRYWEQAAEQAPHFELFRHQRRPQDTAAFLQAGSSSIIGLEAHHVTLQLAGELEAIPGITWRHLDRPVEPLRAVKSGEEIEGIRAAAKITDAAMAALPALIQPGITERQLAWRLEQQMRESGAESMAFPPIVAFGPHSARPHHAPGDRPLTTGEILLVDMGAQFNGYCSDLTRTFFYGGEPHGLFLEIYDVVLAAQTAAIAGIKPGITTREAHALAANVIAGHGYGDYFAHGLGHGVGLEIHEEPFLSATRDEQKLVEGMTVTVEPGIYIPGWGGVRLEDLGHISRHKTSLLSDFSKKPAL